MITLVLGIGWGLLAASPLARRARRSAVIERLGSDHEPGAAAIARERPRSGRWHERLGPVGRVVGSFTGRRARARREAELTRELPLTVDLLAVAVGAGCTPYLAVEVASRWAPAPLRACLLDVGHDCALGVSFADALERMAGAHPPLRSLVDALLASERFGAPVGEALARVAVEQRAALRRRAEAQARTVPVRMLFPLVFLVLPAFALLSVVPVLIAGLSST